MTEMQFKNNDEALEYLRAQLSLATELTKKLMAYADDLKNRHRLMRAAGVNAMPGASGRPDGKGAGRVIFKVIEGGLSKKAN